jgi:hypothetical protein
VNVKKTLAQRMAEGDFLTVDEAAEEIDASNKTIRRLISAGRLLADFEGIWWIQRRNLDEVRNRTLGRHPERELTPKEIKQIRTRRCAGEILRTIATDFQITTSRVSQIGLKYQRRKGR